MRPLKSSTETIVAQATPAGRGGVSILRLSGPEVSSIAEKLLGSLPAPRLARYNAFLDQEGQVLDQGLALFFPGPNSFTGEDVLELHGHGGPVLVDLLMRRVLQLGARLARPGEFSERAFLSGKIDLAQAEAIADLIQASTEAAARSAVRSLQGEFSKEVQLLTETVIQLRMYIEAAIDFADEEIDFLSDQGLEQRFQMLVDTMTSLQKNARQGSLLRDGLSVVIAGKPNVGKSTLLNLLSGKELAIVTDVPGTTRDTLRDLIQIDGIPLHLVDTAGLRETDDPIEKEGIRRAHKEIEMADLILYLVSAEEELATLSFEKKNIPTVIIRNKIDLVKEGPSVQRYQNLPLVSLSARENLGVELLKDTIKEAIGFTTQNEGTFSARQRHLDALKRAREALDQAYLQLKQNRAGELIAEDLRHMQKALSEITGEFTTEDLLGRIFSSFCIGK